MDSAKEKGTITYWQRKKNDNAIIQNEIHERHNIGINKLFNNGQVHDYTNLPFVTFKKLFKPELQAFIHVRQFNTAKVPRGIESYTNLNKGKIDDAEGIPNLMRVAFNIREQPVILSRPKTDDNGHVILSDDEEGEVILFVVCCCRFCCCS